MPQPKSKPSAVEAALDADDDDIFVTPPQKNHSETKKPIVTSLIQEDDDDIFATAPKASTKAEDKKAIVQVGIAEQIESQCDGKGCQSNTSHRSQDNSTHTILLLV